MVIAFLFAFIVFMPSTIFAQSEVEVFNGSDLEGWEEKSFEGNSQYQLTGNGLSASCDGGASSMYRKIEINLNETPVLNWSWRVNSMDGFSADERSKAGDDFAARIYVVRNDGLIIPDILSLSYVWAQGETIGSDWSNPFYKKAHMIVLNNAGQNGQWITQSRNLKDDFKAYFGKDINTIDGIAIMTDCDNTGGRASAQYGSIKMKL